MTAIRTSAAPCLKREPRANRIAAAIFEAYADDAQLVLDRSRDEDGEAIARATLIDDVDRTTVTGRWAYGDVDALESLLDRVTTYERELALH